jgi:hypothetical protein
MQAQSDKSYRPYKSYHFRLISPRGTNTRHPRSFFRGIFFFAKPSFFAFFPAKRAKKGKKGGKTKKNEKKTKKSLFLA